MTVHTNPRVASLAREATQYSDGVGASFLVDMAKRQAGVELTRDEACELIEAAALDKPRSNGARAPEGADLPVRPSDFYAYMPEHKYIFTPTREMWPASSVNARLSITGDDGNQVKASAWLDANRPVEQMTWAPGEPELVEDRLIAHGGWIEHWGARTFNLYRPPAVRPLDGDPDAAGPWIDHVRRLFPNEADHIIPWFAHRVQRPNEKINHALVLQGPQGTGKDTIVEGVGPALGPWNMAEVSPDQLLGRFNGFLKAVVLRVSEARDLGDHDRYRLYEHMKTVIAAPPAVLRVDEKHIREYAIPNLVGVVVTTNHRDGIYLPPDDRRHFVAWTELTKDDFEEAYWTELYAWYEREGFRHIAAYLHAYDLADFNPKAPPPKTPGWWAVVDAGRSPEDAELADALDKLQEPEAVTLRDLANVATHDFANWLTDRRNARQVPHRLEDAGYVPVRNPDAKDGRWRVGGKKQAVYARRDLSVRDRITAAQRIVEASR